MQYYQQYQPYQSFGQNQMNQPPVPYTGQGNNFTPQMAPTMPVPSIQTQGIIYVQGRAGAQAYQVAAGQSALLMDAQEPIIYYKQTDIYGRPQPMLVGYVDFKEEGKEEVKETVVPDMSSYVKKEDLEASIAASVAKILDEKLGNMQLKVTTGATTPNFVIN